MGESVWQKINFTKTMIHLWKIKRELNRLKQQILSRFSWVWENIQQRRYDQNFPSEIEFLHGATPCSDQYALLLCYQPNGLSESTYATCKHLRSYGYNVLLVSNAPVLDSQKERLLACVWQIAIRPNIGYDFGGYRDGLRILSSSSRNVSSLVVLNDSIWFPLHVASSAHDFLKPSEYDFEAAVQLHKAGNPGKYFFESYLFKLSGDVLRSPRFLQFWKNYHLSSIKYAAVKNGERGLSKFVIGNGISHSATYSASKLFSLINDQDSAFLFKTLTYAAYVDPSLESRGQSLMQCFDESIEWRNSALSHIREVIQRHHFHAALVYPSIKLLGTPFLKKSNIPMHQKMRKMYLTAVEHGDLEPPIFPEILNEIRLSSQKI